LIGPSKSNKQKNDNNHDMYLHAKSILISLNTIRSINIVKLILRFTA